MEETKNKNNKFNYLKFISCGALALGGVYLVYGLTNYGVQAGYDRNIRNLTKQINSNIVSVNEAVNSFNLVSINVKTLSSKEYALSVYGNAILINQKDTKFLQLSYNVDKDLFDLIKNTYRFNDSKKINDVNKYPELFNDVNKNRKMVFEKLNEVTKSRCEDIVVIEDENKYVSNLGAKNLKLLEITKPIIDKENNQINFGLSVLNNQEVMFLEFEMPLNKELEENPNNVYKNYLNGEGKLSLYNKIDISKFVENNKEIENYSM